MSSPEELGFIKLFPMVCFEALCSLLVLQLVDGCLMYEGGIIFFFEADLENLPDASAFVCMFRTLF